MSWPRRPTSTGKSHFLQTSYPTDLISQSSNDDGRGAQYFEVRLTDSDVGQLLVSIRTGDAQAVAAGINHRGGLLHNRPRAMVQTPADCNFPRALRRRQHCPSGCLDATAAILVRHVSKHDTTAPWPVLKRPATASAARTGCGRVDACCGCAIVNLPGAVWEGCRLCDTEELFTAWSLQR